MNRGDAEIAERENEMMGRKNKEKIKKKRMNIQ